jgi:predicted PurR-regulated permease PerM
MTEERAGRLSRLRRRLPAVRAAAAPRARILASALGATRPRRTAATGIPTLDDLLNPDLDEADVLGEQPAAPPAAEDVRPAVQESEDLRQRRFGAPGRPLNRAHPFYVGFVGALGVLVAYGLVSLLGKLSTVVTLLAVSLFLALGLDPVVRWLQARGVRRGPAITIVFLGVVAVFAGFVSAVIPPVVAQATDLVTQLPQYAEDLQRAVDENAQLSRFDDEYQVTQRIQNELQKRVSSGETVTALFGGIFGAGRAVVSGIFSALTVLVLTLYFLASLHGMKAAGYHLVPASRRRRVQLLGDEVTRRIGGYVGGQLLLASINGVASFVVLSIMGIPYAAVLAFTVGLLGIIPLVGATLGAVIVVVVALFTSVTDALVLTGYYLVYQQFENYVLGPRIMERTVSVPGAVALVAALAGGSLLGILGALIAIPLAAGVLLIVQEVLMPRQDRS